MIYIKVFNNDEPFTGLNTGNQIIYGYYVMSDPNSYVLDHYLAFNSSHINIP